MKYLNNKKYQTIAFILMCFLLPSPILAADTPITFYKSFEGNIEVTTIGNSELTETGGNGDCGNDATTSASLNLPAGATIKAAYLYWYAMTANITVGDSFNFGSLSNSSEVTFPGYSGTVHKTRSFSAQKFDWGGYWKYDGRFADVTSQVNTTPNGTYTVDVAGGASVSACPLSEENARGWNLIVIYEAPSLTTNKKIYIYDGLKGYLNESISIPVSGFEVPATATAGSLTVVSIQGDENIPGEYMNTSDTSFPSFPTDFANGDHGAALDIDTLTGNFTTGSTSMNINSGSNQDLIFTTNVILSIPTVPASKCFAMTDNVAELYSFDLDIATAPTKVTTTMALNGEGATYRSSNNSLYAFHQPVVGNTDPSDLYKVEMDGTVSLVKAGFLTEAGVGAEFIHYSDGSERLMVLQHQYDSKLLVFDAQNLTSNTPLSTIPLLFPDGSTAKVSGLAVNPVTGAVLVVDDNGGSTPSTDYPEIYSVNLNTGQLTLITALTVPGIDAESLAFAEDGELYVENDKTYSAAAYQNKIFRVDLTTGNITAVEENIDSVVSGDIEGMSCTGSKILTTVNNTSLTVVTKITNDNSGTMGVNDFGVTTDAGTLVFDAGVTVGSIKTYTASSLPVSAGSYQLFANKIANYTEGNWSCSGNSGELTLNHIFVEGTVQSSVNIANGDSVTCTITFNDNAASSCSVNLSGDINAGFSPASKLKNGEKIFLASTSTASDEGHLKAFPITSNGLPSATADWDAYTAMSTQNQRLTRLFSTSDGNKVLFNNLDNEAFGNDGIPSNATIKSTNGSATLGAVSPNSNLALLDNRVNTMLYLTDSAYKTFYKDTISPRSSATGSTSAPKLVLMSSDDGFLYAFKQSNGYLHWGWTPRTLVKEMRNASGFTAQHLMQGTIDTMDLKHGSSYDSYVVGSYRNGLGQYVLKLNTDSTLDSIVWDSDHKDSNPLAATSPNHGKRAYFSDGSGKKHMAYVITTTENTSILHIRSITDTSVHYQIALDFTATSTPFVMPKFKGVVSNTLYLGDSNGNIYSAPLLIASGNNKGNLNTEAALTNTLKQSAVASLYTSTSSAVQFIGVSTAKTGNAIYLRAQSKDRLTVFMYQVSDASWVHKWTTTIGNAGKWINNSNTLTADTAIASLPSGAIITADAYVVGNSIVLPVTLPPSGSDCEGDAYYYLYRITDGHIPTKTFYYTHDSSAVTGAVSIGKGDARRLHVAEHPGSKKLIGLGMSDQKSNGNAGINTSFYIEDHVATGVRSWKKLH